ncbi:MAG: hypothetical protein WDO15_29500 [Bacteroidota bacterium]
MKKPSDHQQIKKENAKGFTYKRIMVKEIKNLPIDFVWLELEKGARRKMMVRTEAYEFKYVIKGTVEYIIAAKNTYRAKETLYSLMDAMNIRSQILVKHRPSYWVVYFFISAGA